MSLREFNERLAVWVVDRVSTMGCAYLFGLIALTALPQAIGETFSEGFHPFPLVTWLSQSFLQLVLLSIIMVGQDAKAQALKDHSESVHSRLDDLQDHHLETQRILKHVHAALNGSPQGKDG